MEQNSLEERILARVLEADYQPVKPRVIAHQLGIPQGEIVAVRRAVKGLVRAGKLSYGRNHLVRPPGDASQKTASPRTGHEYVGVFRRTKAGHGFVRVLSQESPSMEIHVTAARALDAASGDTVEVRLRNRRGFRGTMPSGEIVRIVERAAYRFVGTYQETGGLSFVRIDGNAFPDPILVGDATAKNAQVNDKVLVEVVKFPTHLREGEGTILEVLGPRGKQGVDTLSVIYEFNLPQEFPEDVIAEAHVRAEEFEEQVPPGREDLTGRTVITIDPKDARDFDDAISLERTGPDHWLLGVHIADVSHFVRPGTALDREARQRATSVYLPDQVIPMLPETISNHLASLQPDKVRLTRSLFLEFTPEGSFVSAEPRFTAIKNCRRFSYEEVDHFLADREKWEAKLTPAVHKLLSDMHELAMILRKRRMERGALEMEMPEVKVELDRKGRVSGARAVQHTESHQIIEEFMLAANEGVARTLFDAKYPLLRRVHPSPEPRKLRQLTEFVKELGLDVHNLQDRFELQKLLRFVLGQPEQPAVHYAVLRSLQRAVYGPEEEGHFALAIDCYCHFTSPIRRYPDLVIHRLLEALMRGKRPDLQGQNLEELGVHCSEREQRAESAERQLTKLKLLHYFSGKIGSEMEGVITGVEPYGFFVQGLELPVEGLVSIASLHDDRYRFERKSHQLVGFRRGNSFRLGDRVRVAVAEVDLDRRVLDFKLVGRSGKQASKSFKGKSRKQRQPKKPTRRRKR